MKIFRIFVVGLLSFALYAQDNMDHRLNKIDHRVSDFAKKMVAGGVAVAVIYPDPSGNNRYLQAVFNAGYFREPGSEAPGEDSIFHLGTLTEIFTASVLAKFVSEGKVSLDDLAQKYVPPGIQLPTLGGKQITLRQLATHTSGLPSDVKPSESPYTTEDFFAWLSKLKLKHAPGTKYVESNVGYGLLGIILSQIGGETYEDVVVSEFCKILEMRDTRIHYSGSASDRMGLYYTKKGKPVELTFPTFPALEGALGFSSTLNDMGRFLAFNMGLLDFGMNEILPILQHREFDRKDDHYVCLGWNDQRLHTGSVRIFTINGNLEAFSAFIAFVPETKTGVVVLANAQSETRELGREILRIFNP